MTKRVVDCEKSARFDPTNFPPTMCCAMPAAGMNLICVSVLGEPKSMPLQALLALELDDEVEEDDPGVLEAAGAMTPAACKPPACVMLALSNTAVLSC